MAQLLDAGIPEPAKLIKCVRQSCYFQFQKGWNRAHGKQKTL